jgi:predicted phosphohydrolase
MEKEEAIAIMHQLSRKLEHIVALEDMVSPFAEFMVHMKPQVSEADFAFLGAIGAMIYLKGSHQYNSSIAAGRLLEKVRKESEMG